MTSSAVKYSLSKPGIYTDSLNGFILCFITVTLQSEVNVRIKIKKIKNKKDF